MTQGHKNCNLPCSSIRHWLLPKGIKVHFYFAQIKIDPTFHWIGRTFFSFFSDLTYFPFATFNWFSKSKSFQLIQVTTETINTYNWEEPEQSVSLYLCVCYICTCYTLFFLPFYVYMCILSMLESVAMVTIGTHGSFAFLLLPSFHSVSCGWENRNGLLKQHQRCIVHWSFS